VQNKLADQTLQNLEWHSVERTLQPSIGINFLPNLVRSVVEQAKTFQKISDFTDAHRRVLLHFGYKKITL